MIFILSLIDSMCITFSNHKAIFPRIDCLPMSLHLKKELNQSKKNQKDFLLYINFKFFFLKQDYFIKKKCFRIACGITGEFLFTFSHNIVDDGVNFANMDLLFRKFWFMMPHIVRRGKS